MKSRRIFPCNFVWKKVDVTDGEGIVKEVLAMVPQERYAGVAERQYLEGEPYALVPLESRSRASHDHFFAALQNGFDNLPEGIAWNFPTPEHLRKWLLIETGQFKILTWNALTKSQANRHARQARVDEPYARIRVFETTDEETKARCWAIEIKRAVSQSAKEMGREAFQASKTAVLERLAVLIGTTARTLEKETARHA